MAIDERIQVLEDEFKLIRGELKQTLTNVRDFLLDINLPALQQEAEGEKNAEMHEHEEFHEDGKEASPQQNPAGGPFPPVPPQAAEPASQLPEQGEAKPSIPPPPVSQAAPMEQPPPPTIRLEGVPPPAETITTEQDQELPLDDMAEFQEEEPSEAPEEMEEMEQDQDQVLPPQDMASDRRQQSEEGEKVIRYTEQVNLLTNLIRWVSTARREIGNEQLPAFLDVYSIGGHLSSELREIILHLAETIAPKTAGAPADITLSIEANENVAPPAEVKTEATPSAEAKADAATLPNPVADADVWSRMILELHGILSRGGASFHPLQISWNGRGEDETLQNKNTAEGENSEAEPSSQPNVAATQEDEAEEKMEDRAGNKPSKKGKSKAKRRRSDDRLSSLKENKPARLKLVLPLGDDGEKEFSIGGFSINLAPEGD